MQTTTSANTSINQIPRGYTTLAKQGYIGNAECIFDFGCGKYLDKLNQWAGAHNCCIIGYDPYNQSNEHNEQAYNTLSSCTHMICNNVLNVLDDSILHATIAKMVVYMHIGHIQQAYITVYHGDRSGIGKHTKADCYQRNEPYSAYIQVLKQYFSIVTLKSGILHCTI